MKRRIFCLVCILVMSTVWVSSASAGLLNPFGWPTGSDGEETSFARWTKTSNNKMNFKFQVYNGGTKTVVAVEYYYYTTDVWGDNRDPADEDKIYKVTLTDKIGPGKTVYNSGFSISNRDQVGRVYVRINRYKYEDGTVRNMPRSSDYMQWDITW